MNRMSNYPKYKIMKFYIIFYILIYGKDVQLSKSIELWSSTLVQYINNYLTVACVPNSIGKYIIIIQKSQGILRREEE